MQNPKQTALTTLSNLIDRLQTRKGSKPSFDEPIDQMLAIVNDAQTKIAAVTDTLPPVEKISPPTGKEK